ncbi:Arv1-like family [Popillia japonica]|uniref:Protein ARV n=1 Tax=Popillia japonica TaxID=7064 RepID=A0AAW1KKS0_POPJA
MEQISYICTNCGTPVNDLFKEYSPSVLKLTKCLKCMEVADKYVEYDPVIVIIDLVLLRKEAYRHVLYNTQFKFHWKLCIIIHIIEAYYEWILKFPSNSIQNKSLEILDNIKEFTINDLIFYKIYILLFMQTLSFIFVLYILTILYNKAYNMNKPYGKLLLEIWKCRTLSNFGVFLLLPSLIWGSRQMLENSLTFVILFTTLSELFGYGVINNYSKGWSAFVISASHCASVSIHYLLSSYVNSHFYT